MRSRRLAGNMVDLGGEREEIRIGGLTRVSLVFSIRVA